MSIFVIKNEKVSFFLTKVEKFRITRKWNIMLGKEWESVLTYISSLWVRKCRKIRSWFILNNVFCEKLSSGKLSEWEIVVWEIVWVGNCLLRNCLMGKSLLGKCRWENVFCESVCWEIGKWEIVCTPFESRCLKSLQVLVFPAARNVMKF